MALKDRVRAALRERRIVPFVGIYDVFSATIVARHFDALFVSGFGLGASRYGLPDVGFVAWPDVVDLVQRIRRVAPEHHILVDIDDGYGDPGVAAHVVSALAQSGASAVVMEDQARPRKCGHLEGKQLLDLDAYLTKLEKVLEAGNEVFVIARTDASEPDEVRRRVLAFGQAGADAILVDGLSDLAMVRGLGEEVGTPIAFNQIAGGKSPPCSLTELADLGIRIAIYSTPALFPVQAAIFKSIASLLESDGRLPGEIGVAECNALLEQNLNLLLPPTPRSDRW
jgi:2-methylisocitrate lyase-like PEP mutase family enzyme